ncbi:hypothetical protein V8J36_05200 [Frigidibacter sp. MR17.14]
MKPKTPQCIEGEPLIYTIALVFMLALLGGLLVAGAALALV